MAVRLATSLTSHHSGATSADWGQSGAGEQAPFVFCDPTGFMVRPPRRRLIETKHGRIAMLAAM
eukprot:15519761-Heterocapsa_arctica.AAC.1